MNAPFVLQSVVNICILKEMLKLFQEHTNEEENKIKKEFEKLHQFLKDEEEKQIRSLRKEMDPQDQNLKSIIEELSKQISDLSDRMAAVWQDMEAENLTFLQVQIKHSTMSGNLHSWCSLNWALIAFYFSFRITVIH